MKRSILLFVALGLALSASAQTIVIDTFDSYQDDVDVQDNWVFSKAGGDDGLAAYLEKTSGVESTPCMMLDVNMPAKWWQNKVRKEIPEGPLDLAKFGTIELLFKGDAKATTDIVASVFLYDSNNRVIKADIPSAFLAKAEWQKFSVSVNALVDETWDDGYGTETPDAVRSDIVAFGLMVTGNEDNQTATYYVDSISITEKSTTPGTPAAETITVDNFESYADDAALSSAWAYSKAGGPDGLFPHVDTALPAEGSKNLKMEVNMPEKWWHNIIRKEIPEGPLDLSKYLNVEFQFAGDPAATPDISFNVFLYDSGSRVIKFALPSEYLTNGDWQKVTLSLDAFSEEEWDSGYGTATPDANKQDIVALGLMVVGNEVNQVANFYVDDIRINAKPENMAVENFESYTSDDDLKAVWAYSKAGGPDGLFISLDKTNTPPEGNNALFMDVNMPEKWWHNIVRKDFASGALSLSKYAAVEMWFYGDSTVVSGKLTFHVFLYDNAGRILFFTLPNDYVVTASWQKVTLALDAFAEQEWDAGYGTATPDADKNNIVALGLMVVGDDVNQVGKFYVDDIQLVSKQAASSVSGIITQDGQPLEGVMVFAVDQTSMRQATTDATGKYAFNDLQQGKQYRILPVKKTLDFNPAAATLTLFGESSIQDFTAVLSPYNRLETTALTDQFDQSGLNPAIVYRGAREWGQNEAGNVRPTIDVTVDKTFTVNFPDAAGVDTTLYAIPQNTQSGATSPKYALEVGGFYGWDMLAFGQNADANYFVEIDAFCEVRVDAPVNMFDRVSLGIHCSFWDPAKPSLDAYADTNTYRSSGGYALSYETDSGILYARKYAPANSKVHAISRTEGYAENYGEITLADSGWHRFRIEYLNGQVTFLVDGKQLAQITDSDYPFGPAGLHFRPCYTDNPTDLAYMQHARFDNLKTGWMGPVSVQDWMLN